MRLAALWSRRFSSFSRAVLREREKNYTHIHNSLLFFCCCFLHCLIHVLSPFKKFLHTEQAQAEKPANEFFAQWISNNNKKKKNTPDSDLKKRGQRREWDERSFPCKFFERNFIRKEKEEKVIFYDVEKKLGFTHTHVFLGRKKEVFFLLAALKNVEPTKNS